MHALEQHQQIRLKRMLIRVLFILNILKDGVEASEDVDGRELIAS